MNRLGDKPLFGITSTNHRSPMLVWVFYFLGAMLESAQLRMGEDFELESFSLGYTFLIKEYMPVDAETIAKSIFEEIKKRVEK